MDAGTAAHRGTLADPEVYDNVPGHVIPILEREFDDFDNESSAYLGGDRGEAEFIGFRLRQGVYGQRQAERQMIRIKLPFGESTRVNWMRWPIRSSATCPSGRRT